MIDLFEKSMGLSGPVLSWFALFLHNRTQRIKVNQSISNSPSISIGVGQGFALSPTLFNVLMEHLTESQNHSNIHYHMYADDTQLYMKISSPEDFKTLNCALLKTQQWLTHNHLMLSTLKMDFLLIAPSTTLPPYTNGSNNKQDTTAPHMLLTPLDHCT